MNLMGLIVAVAVMSIGALTSAYFLIDPPIALSRLRAQAEADTIVETLRHASWKGQKVKLKTDANGNVVVDANGNVVVTVDDTPINVPSNCKIELKKEAFTIASTLAIESTPQLVSVSCSSLDSNSDRRKALYRSSHTVLIGGQPCDSDLFPTPPVTNKNNTFVCTQWLPPPGNNAPFSAGHFDLDSYPGFSTQGLHEHRWDDKYSAYISSTAPGLFDLMRKGDDTPCGTTTSSIPVCAPLGMPQAIPEALPISQPFYLLVTNGKLSPMVVIRFKYRGYKLTSAGTPELDKKGDPIPDDPKVVTCSEDTKNLPDARPFDKCFVLEDPKTTTATTLTAIPFINVNSLDDLPSQLSPGNTSGINYNYLEYLYVGFSQQNPHFAGGVVPTSTALVNGTTSTPGACGEYRNGAFVIQAVSDIPSTLYRLTSASPDPTPAISARLGQSCGATYGMPFTTIQSAPGSVSSSKPATISGTPFTGPGGNYISNGGTGLAVDNVIYELSIFWHANSGYTDSMDTMFRPLQPATVSMYSGR